MKIVKTFVFLITLSLILTSCTRPTTDSTEKIVPPKNQLMAIEGTWKISEILMTEVSIEDEEKEEWLNQKIQFSSLYMSLGESVLENPEYQMKRVNAEQYLLFNSKLLPKNFSFSTKEVEVITVIDKDKFFCDVLIISEDELILKIQGNSFSLNKISDEVDEYTVRKIDDENNQEQNMLISEDELNETGVLIGLRSEISSSNSEKEYSYRTLWISSTNNKISSILEIDDIVFPRRSGFWRMEIKKETQGSRTEEYIIANNILTEDNKAELQLKNKVMRSEGLIEGFSIEEEPVLSEIDFSRWKDRIGQITRKINYIGNDYVSIETTGKGEYITGSEAWEKSKLELLPIDSLPNGNAVKISDILNEDGVISMKSAWEKAINNMKIDSPDILYREELLENFGLQRKLGHWLIKGRINYIRDKEFNIYDYSISMMPPSKVVTYDTLFVPWTNIKDVEPRALDAYTSPNKDIAIVITRDELLIYSIYGNDLSRYPIERIDIKEGETVIMAEWATGQYVQSWESILQKSGAVVVEY